MAKAKLTNEQKALNRKKYEDISSPKNKIIVKFNCLDKTKRYLKSEGYKYTESYSFKEDRAMLYRKYNNWLKVTSTFDYLNDNTLEMGTVWTIQSL